MTQADFDRVVANAAANPAFRAQIRANAAQALAGFDLTPQEKANLAAQNIGAEPTAGKTAGKDAGKGNTPPPGSETVDPAKSFASKTRFDKASGKHFDKVTGREVRPPTDPDAGPGGTLGGRPGQ